MAGELRRVRPQLVQRCNEALLNGLLDHLLLQKVLDDPEVEMILQGSTLLTQKCRSLIDTVIRKGDPSCNTLLQKIIEKDLNLSEDLGITVQLSLPTQEQNSSCGQATPSDNKGITLCSEAEYQEITTKETERYPIYDKSNRKRWALVICNILFKDKAYNREGADIDLKEMTNLLEGLGYNVRSSSNLTAEEMRSTIKSFAADTDHSKSDSTFLVFMSHGDKDIIYGTDVKSGNVTSSLHVDEIFNTFNNKNCPGLRDKPKMIIIQACRGEEESLILVNDGAQTTKLKQDSKREMLKEADFICFYSTTPDTLSYRLPKKGSLFIQCLINIMKSDAHNSSIEDIFRRVRHSFKNGLQMPTLERTTLLKKFFLFPGY